MDEVTRLALELAWQEGFDAGLNAPRAWYEEWPTNPYSRKKD